MKLSIVLFEQKAKLDGFVYARLQVFQKVTEIIKGNLDVIEFLKYMMDAFIVIVLCNRALTVLVEGVTKKSRLILSSVTVPEATVTHP